MTSKVQPAADFNDDILLELISLSVQDEPDPALWFDRHCLLYPAKKLPSCTTCNKSFILTLNVRSRRRNIGLDTFLRVHVFLLRRNQQTSRTRLWPISSHLDLRFLTFGVYVSFSAALVDKNDHTPVSPQEKMLRLVLEVPKNILCKDGRYLSKIPIAFAKIYSRVVPA